MPNHVSAAAFQKLSRRNPSKTAFAQPRQDTETDKKLLYEIMADIDAELDQESQVKQEQAPRMKKNLLSHHFFWERVKPLWSHLKTNERFHILKLLRDTEWNQQTIAEIKQIEENAQFLEYYEFLRVNIR
jgi:hypothetical protein